MIFFLPFRIHKRWEKRRDWGRKSSFVAVNFTPGKIWRNKGMKICKQIWKIFICKYVYSSVIRGVCLMKHLKKNFYVNSSIINILFLKSYDLCCSIVLTEISICVFRQSFQNCYIKKTSCKMSQASINVPTLSGYPIFVTSREMSICLRPGWNVEDCGK